MIVAEGFLPVGNLLMGAERRGFFIHNLNTIFYPTPSDALGHFYKIVNGENIFLLGSANYTRRDWITIVIAMKELSSLSVNPNWPGFFRVEEGEDGTQNSTANTSDFIHFYFKATINYALMNGSMEEVSLWQSPIFEKRYPDF